MRLHGQETPSTGRSRSVWVHHQVGEHETKTCLDSVQCRGCRRNRRWEEEHEADKMKPFRNHSLGGILRSLLAKLQFEASSVRSQRTRRSHRATSNDELPYPKWVHTSLDASLFRAKVEHAEPRDKEVWVSVVPDPRERQTRDQPGNVKRNAQSAVQSDLLLASEEPGRTESRNGSWSSEAEAAGTAVERTTTRT